MPRVVYSQENMWCSEYSYMYSLARYCVALLVGFLRIEGGVAVFEGSRIRYNSGKINMQ